MLYLLDTANLEAISYFAEYYPLSSVTTNPTLISKEKVDFLSLVRSIREIIGENKMLHIQSTKKNG